MSAYAANYRIEERIVRIPVDAQRSRSRKCTGASSDLLRQKGTNKLLGPTESYSIEEARRLGVVPSRPDAPRGPGGDGLTVGQQVAAQFLTEILEAVVVQVVAPAVGRRIRKLANRSRDAIRRDGHLPRSAETCEQDCGTNLVRRIEANEVVMSAEEFALRLREALFADAYAKWQRDQLSKARVDNGTVPVELHRAFEKLLMDGASASDQQEWEALVDFLECARLVDADNRLELAADDDEA